MVRASSGFRSMLQARISPGAREPSPVGVAKRHQRIQPVYAWAYAVQYAYEKDTQERRRALAMTYYLDPAAAHIHRFARTEFFRA